MNIAVIGAGNGGQAIAGDLAIRGHDVSLYDSNFELLDTLKQKGGIELEGQIVGFAKVTIVYTISEAISNAEIIMIVTTANAHGILGEQMSPFLKESQVVILNPGRTGGALEFRAGLNRANCNKRIYLAEAQTLVFACGLRKTGLVNIIGIKDKILLSSLPSTDTNFILNKISCLYNCFIPAQNVLVTSLENIGAIFHPIVVLFNAAAIERDNSFYFYRDMTPEVARFIEKIDEERLKVGKAYGINLLSAKDWVSFAYSNIKGDTLCDRMRNNPAYHDILAPTSIKCRMLTEDVPTGLLPISELGKLMNVRCDLMNSVITISQTLLNCDFYATGRTLANLGIQDMNKDKLLNSL